MKIILKTGGEFRFSRKFTADSIWNLFGFGVMGLVGISLNLVIAKFYKPEILGVFNQAYSILILASQFSGFGLHLSTLKLTSEFYEDENRTKKIITSGMLGAFITSCIVCSIFYYTSPLLAHFFKSSDLGEALTCITPAIFFLSLNKVLLASLNGCHKMKLFSLFQILKSVFYLTSLVVLIRVNWSPSGLAMLFSISETLLFLFLFIYFVANKLFAFSFNFFTTIITHFKFGLKAFIGNSLLDVNTRVDVLVLGVFCTDHLVGIYSFAAMLADGFYQGLIVSRHVANPLITQLYFQGKKIELFKMFVGLKIILYKFAIPTGLSMVLVYLICIRLFNLSLEMQSGWIVFLILQVGFVSVSGILPFITFFNQIGAPGEQSLLLIVLFASNCILNVCLIPFFNIFGAAIATSMSWFFFIWYFSWRLRKKIINIVPQKN